SVHFRGARSRQRREFVLPALTRPGSPFLFFREPFALGARLSLPEEAVYSRRLFSPALSHPPTTLGRCRGRVSVPGSGPNHEVSRETFTLFPTHGPAPPTCGGQTHAPSQAIAGGLQWP